MSSDAFLHVRKNVFSSFLCLRFSSRRKAFRRDFSIKIFNNFKRHSPHSKFRAGTFFTFKYFSSFFNFNLRLRNVKINFSIHVTLLKCFFSVAWNNLSSLARGRWMHMKFCEKTKLHRRLDAVYIAIFIHVLYCANSVGGGIRSEEENVLFVRRRGWKWFVYIFSLWNFPNSHSAELDTREQRVGWHEKTLLSDSNFAENSLTEIRLSRAL